MIGSGCGFVLGLCFADAGIELISESNAASRGMTLALDSVLSGVTVLLSISETVAMLDSGCSLVLVLPFGEAGAEPILEADSASCGATSALPGVSPASTVVFSVFDSAATLDLGGGFALWLTFVEAGTVRTAEVDRAFEGTTSALGGV